MGVTVHIVGLLTAILQCILWVFWLQYYSAYCGSFDCSITVHTLGLLTAILQCILWVFWLQYYSAYCGSFDCNITVHIVGLLTAVLQCILWVFWLQYYSAYCGSFDCNIVENKAQKLKKTRNRFHKEITYIKKLPSWHIWIDTPRSKVHLEKLTGLQLVKCFPAFYRNRRFNTAFTSAR